MLSGYAPVLMLAVIAGGFAIASIMISSLIGQKKPNPDKLSPYECGAVPIGDAREQHPARYYVVAMLFTIFDVEAAFMFPWAVLFKDLGLAGLIEMIVFMLILILGYVYLREKGALEWE